jgi:hypothetical protein
MPCKCLPIYLHITFHAGQNQTETQYLSQPSRRARARHIIHVIVLIIGRIVQR